MGPLKEQQHCLGEEHELNITFDLFLHLVVYWASKVLQADNSMTVVMHDRKLVDKKYRLPSTCAFVL